MEKKLIYNIGDKPKFGKLIVFAIQQLLAIMAATIAVPTIIGLPTQIPAAIFGAGIGTLVYQLFTRGKSPVFLGSSFAFLSPLFAAVVYGYCGIIIGSVAAGLVYVIIALIVHFTGTKWVNKLLPPVIIGPTVALIGLSLAVNAMGDIVKSNVAPDGGYIQAAFGGYSLIALVCGLITFFVIVICATQKKYTMPKLIPFIIGIGAGYVCAVIFTVIGNYANLDYLKVINFDVIKASVFNDAGEFKGLSAIFSIPNFSLFAAIEELAPGTIPAGLATPIKDAIPVSIGAVVELLVAFVPVALVAFAEHLADHKNLSSIIDKDLIEEPGLKRTLLGDGVGSMVGTMFGVCPNTTYGESVGCVAITKNASVITITTTAIMCMVLSFITPIMAVLQSIPSCVMGGACLTLYGFIAVSGLKMFKDLDLNNSRNQFVVAAILIAGIGGLALKIPYDFSGAAVEFIEIKNIATALILGIITNAVLTKVEKIKSKKASASDVDQTEE